MQPRNFLLLIIITSLLGTNCKTKKIHPRKIAISSPLFDTCNSEVFNLRTRGYNNDFATPFNGSLLSYSDSLIHIGGDRIVYFNGTESRSTDVKSQRKNSVGRQSADSLIYIELLKMTGGCDIEMGFEISTVPYDEKGNDIANVEKGSQIIYSHQKVGRISERSGFLLINTVAIGYNWNGYEKIDTILGTIKCIFTNDLKYMKVQTELNAQKSIFILRNSERTNSPQNSELLSGFKNEDYEAIKILKPVLFDF